MTATASFWGVTSFLELPLHAVMAYPHIPPPSVTDAHTGRAHGRSRRQVTPAISLQKLHGRCMFRAALVKRGHRTSALDTRGRGL